VQESDCLKHILDIYNIKVSRDVASAEKIGGLPTSMSPVVSLDLLMANWLFHECASAAMVVQVYLSYGWDVASTKGNRWPGQ
jgi:hypothetical protein